MTLPQEEKEEEEQTEEMQPEQTTYRMGSTDHKTKKFNPEKVIASLLKRENESEKYIIDSKVAQGGMGAIYKVHDQDLNRTSVLKIILPGVMKDALLFRRFIEEAQITGELEHPNIIPVHELGALGEDKLYFSMKLVQGEALGTILKQVRDGNPDFVERYSPFALLTIFRKVCDAVAYAHSKNIIHRDIKPDNIMVGSFGEVLLMDWGLARREKGKSQSVDGADPSGITQDDDNELKTQYGVVKGTPAYMSPEQAKGEVDEIDHRSDIFLLGSTLYAMVSFQVPFTGNDIYDILANAENGNFIDPGNRAPERQIPEELCRIIMKAMAYNRENRYQTVEELSLDLDALLEGNTVSIHKHFEAGEYLMQEGESGYEAYMIISGDVEVTKKVRGKEINLISLSAGDVIGEMALILKATRSASVKAIEDTEVVVITEETMKQGLSKLPPWMGKAVDSLAERLRKANVVVHPLVNGDCTYHVLNQLCFIHHCWSKPTELTDIGQTVVTLETKNTIHEIAINLSIPKKRVMIVFTHLLNFNVLTTMDENYIYIPNFVIFYQLLNFSKQQMQLQHSYGDVIGSSFFTQKEDLIIKHGQAEGSLSSECSKILSDPNHTLNEIDLTIPLDDQFDQILNTIKDELVPTYSSSS